MSDPERPPMLPAARNALAIGCGSILAAPVVALALGFVGYRMCVGSGGIEGFALPVVGVVLGVPAVVAGFRALGKFTNDPRVPGRGAALGAIVLGILSGLIAATLGVVGAFLTAAAGNLPGRPFRVRGRPRVAAVTSGYDWNGALPKVSVEGVSLARRTELALAWQAEAQGEHASIASFSRLALELLAAGAPPALVAEAHRAALDEIAHAQACFSIANAYGEVPVAPMAWPEALANGEGGSLAALAVGSLVDGCLHEGFAAEAARIGAERCTDEGVRSVLTTLAADESRHADLGWSILRWCVATGGDGVRDALTRAASDLPTETPRGCFAPGDDAPDAVADAFRGVRAKVLATVRDVTYGAASR